MTYELSQYPNNELFLPFKLDTDIFAVESRYVSAISNMLLISPLPGTPEYLKGIAKVEGQIIPVIDMAGTPTRNSCLISGLSNRKPFRLSRSSPFLTNSSWNIQPHISTLEQKEESTQPTTSNRSQTTNIILKIIFRASMNFLTTATSGLYKTPSISRLTVFSSFRIAIFCGQWLSHFPHCLHWEATAGFADRAPSD